MHVFALKVYNKSNHVQVNFDLKVKYRIKNLLVLSSQNVIFIQCSFSTILKSQLTYIPIYDSYIYILNLYSLPEHFVAAKL